jgi:hypothetical protein
MGRRRVVNQGEIYDYGRLRVLVVSTDAHNAVRTPWLAPIRRGDADIPPYRIAFIEPDPLAGFVDLDKLGRGLPEGEPIAIVAGATMARVRDAIQTVFAD